MINYDGFMTADEAIADITDNPAYASLSAVKNNKVFSVNLNEVYCSGVRTYDGIMTFAKALYPDLYEIPRRAFSKDKSGSVRIK